LEAALTHTVAAAGMLLVPAFTSSGEPNDSWQLMYAVRVVLFAQVPDVGNDPTAAYRAARFATWLSVFQ
jgi:hypothetical protein